jgi:hypothetical protein
MNRFFSRFLAAAVFGTAVLGAASAAQAHTDVFVSVGAPARPVYVEPAPVFVQPRPVYGPPVFVHERPWRPSYDSEFEQERAWRRAEWQRREWERQEWKRRYRHGWDRPHSYPRD